MLAPTIILQISTGNAELFPHLRQEFPAPRRIIYESGYCFPAFF